EQVSDPRCARDSRDLEFTTVAVCEPIDLAGASTLRELLAESFRSCGRNSLPGFWSSERRWTVSLGPKKCLAGFAGREYADHRLDMFPLTKEARPAVAESGGQLHQTMMSTWFAGMRS